MKTLPSYLRCLVVCIIVCGSCANAQKSSRPVALPEDLNSLSLSSHPLSALPPLLLEKDEKSGFIREMVRVQWREEDPIYLFVVTPKGVKKPPVVVYLYTYPAEISRFQNDGFCKVQIKDGFAAVGFVSALAGHRYHDRPMAEWFVSQLQESLVKSVHDMSMILDYIGTRNDLDSTRVGMFGEGSGGAIAVLSASVEPRLKAIDLLDPWGDWPNWFSKSSVVPEEERTTYLQPEFLRPIASFDPLTKLPALTLPLRYQYLTDPTGTPQTVRDHLQAVLPSQAVIISKDRGIAAYKASGGSDFFDWIKDRLR